VQFRLWSIKRLNAVIHVSGKCNRPPPKTSGRHLGLHPQSDIRFFSWTSSTLTILRKIAKTTTKSLTNVFHIPENKKFQPKQKLFFIFTDTLATSSFCFLFFPVEPSTFAGIARWIIIGKASFLYHERRVQFLHFVRRREVLIPGEKRSFDSEPSWRDIDRLRGILAAHFSQSRPR